MNHIDAATSSTFNFAIRPNMLFGGDEQFLIGSEENSRYYRLVIINAGCFDDWEPLGAKEPLEALRKNYPYINIPAEPAPINGQVQGQQGQKLHGRKKKV